MTYLDHAATTPMLEGALQAMVEELRQTLTDMPPGEQSMIYVAQQFDGPIVPVWMRPNDTWQWKVESSHVPLSPELAVPDPVRTHTRADWLFAYWLARAAGELDPGTAALPSR